MKNLNIYIITDFPEITLMEIKELINKKGKSYGNVCHVKDIDTKDIAKLVYHMQSIKKVCVELFNFKVENDNQDILISNFKTNFKKIDDKFLSNINTFEARSEHNEKYSFSNNEINKLLGELVLNSSNLKVDLTRADLTINCCIEDNCFVGIDIIGFDMSKRPYKIANKADSLNGAFGYSLLRMAGIKKDSCILDPFAGTGIIPIEAALYQNNISNFKFENKFIGFNLDITKKDFIEQEIIERETKKYDKLKIYAYDGLLKTVLSMQKNSKLAGVEKQITMSKINIDWLDTKLEEDSVDLIITDPPKLNKKINNGKEIIKIFDELFYQARYILKNDGKIFILTNDEEIPKKECNKHEFKFKNSQKIKRGDQLYYFIEFIKKN